MGLMLQVLQVLQVLQERPRCVHAAARVLISCGPDDPAADVEENAWVAGAVMWVLEVALLAWLVAQVVWFVRQLRQHRASP